MGNYITDGLKTFPSNFWKVIDVILGCHHFEMFSNRFLKYRQYSQKIATVENIFSANIYLLKVEKGMKYVQRWQ